MNVSLTMAILVITCITSFLAFNNAGLFGKMIFNPYLIHHNRQYYRFITGGLIHADFMHLLINMFVLYSFGGVVEIYYNHFFGDNGRNFFLLLYIGALVASVIPTYKKNTENPGDNGLGASGAVSAVVFAYIIFNPLEKLYLFGIIPIPGIIFGGLYLYYCYYMAKKGGDNINHDAHMWGAIYGVVFTIMLKPSLIRHFLNEVSDWRNIF